MVRSSFEIGVNALWSVLPVVGGGGLGSGCTPRAPVSGRVVVWSSGAVAAVAELFDERWVSRLPVQFRSGFGRDRALVEQEDPCEVVAEAGSGLLVRAGDGSRCADRVSGGLGQLGDGRVDSVADDVVASGP